MHRPRQRAEKLVEVTTEFPEKLPKKIATIIKRVAPFEDMAINAAGDTLAGLDLNDLMEAEGVLNAELVRDIESSGKALRAYIRSNEAKIFAPKEIVKGNEIHTVFDPATAPRFERFVKRVDGNLIAILERLRSDRRPIAETLTYEVMQYSFLLALAHQAVREGIEQTVTMNDNPQRHPAQRAVLDCVVAAARYSIRGSAPVYEHTPQEMFELLRDGAYGATRSTGVPIELPGVYLSGKPTQARVHTHEPQNPLIIASVEVDNPTNGLPLVAFMLSRITGELVPDGMQVISAKEAFDVLSNTATYERIRDAALAGVLHAVEKGHIAERPFVSFTANEQEEIRFRPPKIRLKVPSSIPVTEHGIVTPPAIQDESVEPESYAPESEPARVAKTPERPPMPSIKEQLAEINKPNHAEEKEARVVWLESRITWRRTLAALKRIGVTIDIRGAHPKLQYSGKVTRYLNSHDTDSAHNKRELYRVLRELEISRDTFFAQLK